ncbi:PAAR domain-containing protein [Pseudomonas sp. Z3-6]|uniref:hypothetical protein n=1 Tax=Pseudomonas sp. Z3-6 TaxID=2817411 RepID=UPI003DA814DA
MNASLHLAYTNEASPDFLSHLDDCYFKERQPSGIGEEISAFVVKQRAYVKAHPPIAIYRVATEGSQTRGGGVVKQGTLRMVFTLDNGQQVCTARKGDLVVYADGRTAQIVTTAGEANSHIALVGSRLSNGDEIINTPQKGFLLFAREGVPMAEDFLPAFKPAEVLRPDSNEMKGNMQ